MYKYADIVVTYNRCALLKENIEALLNQTWQEHDIFIIDNASTDSTKELVFSFKDERIHYYNTGKNLGGAGGFAYGLEKVIVQGYEFAWIMDDDSIANKDALQSLIEKGRAIRNNFSFLASLVYWTDGKVFPMNVPLANWSNVVDMDYDMMKNHKLVHIKDASFVGCFVNLSVAKNEGLPISEFFIYGDDLEYTLRLGKIKEAYLDLDSNIIHKAPSNIGADVVTAGADRINRFYYQSRNGMYIARKEKAVLKRLFLIAKRIVKVLLFSSDNRTKRVWTLSMGTVSGVFFNPKLKFVKGKVQ